MNDPDLTARVAALEFRCAQLGSLLAAFLDLAESPQLLQGAIDSGDFRFLVTEGDRIAIEARSVAHIPEGGDMLPNSS